MHGDRRPFPVVLVTLDEEEIVPWAEQQGLPTRRSRRWRSDPKVRELIQAEVDRANAQVAQVEQVKKFVILDHDLSQETGELTPTLKVKRNVVNEKYADAVRRALRVAEPAIRVGSAACPRTMRTDPTDTGGLFVGRRPGTRAGPLPRRCPSAAAAGAAVDRRRASRWRSRCSMVARRR